MREYARDNELLSPGERCYETIKYVGEALHEVVPKDMSAYVVGGIAASALRGDVGTEISVESSELKVQQASDLPLLRTSSKGIVTRRDLDIVVGGHLTLSEKRRVHAQLDRVVGGKMPVSVFDFGEAKGNLSPSQRRVLNLTSFISRRTLPRGVRSVDEVEHSYLELFPFLAKVPRAVYDTWRMYLPGGNDIPVMSPRTTMDNYTIRSLAGLRPKDEAKYFAMNHELLGSLPEQEFEINPVQQEAYKEFLGQSLSVESNKAHQQAFRSDKDRVYRTLDSLAETVDRMQHQVLHKSDVPFDIRHPQAREVDFVAARIRANMLRTAEAHEGIVSRAQSDRIQGVLRFFVGQS